MKKELLKYDIPVPPGAWFLTNRERIPKNLNYPLIVKPSIEHCSIGLSYESIANNSKELRAVVAKQINEFKQPALAEEFITGRELEVYLLEEKNTVRVLPIEEIIFNSRHKFPFQTFDAKWIANSSDFKNTKVVIAKLSDKDRSNIEKTCTRAFKKLGLRGYSRIDLRLRDGVPYILEINANPAVYDDEVLLDDPDKEIVWGIKFSDHVRAIVDSALYHYTRGDII